MIEAVIHHGTEMDVERQYVDSHGQSEVVFAFCHLLGFFLLPRLKGLRALTPLGLRAREPLWLVRAEDGPSGIDIELKKAS